MKKFFKISLLVFLAISRISFAGSLDYKGLEKISKNNTFMDSKGIPYPDDKITDKKNTLLIIFNHGSSADAKRDHCSKKAKVGKIGSGGLVPAIASLHNKKINNLEIKIYRLCSGVKGLTNKQQNLLYDQIKSRGSFELHENWEYKQLKRQKIIAFISFEALHLSKMGKKWITKKTKLNNTNEIIKKIVRLPMHNKLTINEVDYIS